MMILTINGLAVDTDNDTRLGLTYTGPLFRRGGVQLSRSFGLSVPSTRGNDRLFELSCSEDFHGVRSWACAEIQYGGVCLKGRIALESYGGGRYELLFIYGDLATDIGRFTSPIREIVHFTESFTLTGKDVPATGRMLADFGFYSYHNPAVGAGGMVGDPPTIFPSCNLGWLIESAAAAAGYTVTMPTDDGRDPHQFGLVLPSMTVYADTAIRVSGSARGGWTLVSGASSWSDAGLSVVARRYKRGMFGANVTVYTFTAIRPVTVEYAKPSASAPWIFAGGEGYDIRNWSPLYAQPVPSGANALDTSFDLEAGDWFTVVDAADATGNSLFRPWCWRGQDGYTGAVDCTFTVKNSGGDVPLSGYTVYLQDNIPDMSLAQLLQAACDLTACVFEVDSGVRNIAVYPEEEVLQGVDWCDLDTLPVTGVKSLTRSIDGLSRHNFVTCKSADYVAERMRFRRDYPCENDVLDAESELAVIPFNEGNWLDAFGVKYAVMHDVEPAADGQTDYSGTLSVIFENAAGLGGGEALHVQTLNDMGVGKPMAEASRSALTMRITAAIPFRKFATLHGTSLAVWHGRRWAVRSASWADDTAELELIMLNS